MFRVHYAIYALHCHSMDLQWLRDLEGVAATGNFSQAAERNNISQSAFSRRIKALEAWVGAPLIDRSHHPVTLTRAGEQILEAGHQVISRLETAREQVRLALAQPDQYVVTFAAQHSIGWRFYPSWLQSFEKAFGPIMSRLRADDLPNCIADLRKGEVDFVLAYESAYTPSVDPSREMDSVVIGNDRLIPVCKANADGTPLFPIRRRSTVAIPYLRFGPTAPIGRHVEPILKRRNLITRLAPIYENSMGGALRIRARDGLGVAWLPQSLVQPDIDAGLLTWAGDEEWAVEVEIRLYRMKRNDNMLIRKIWTYLKLREGVPLI